jgi:uncharacterized NAD(P)/FAD-binding protein YdhS
VILEVGAIVDCTGIVKDPEATGNPVVRSLFDQGLARIDPLHMGIEVAPDCGIVNRSGLPTRRLFAIGPLTRAAFCEIVAIPDIRNQCVQLAGRMVGNIERASEPAFCGNSSCHITGTCAEGESGAHRPSMMLSWCR